MRHRLLAALALVLVFSVIAAPLAHAGTVVLAQAEEEEGADQSEPGTDTEGGGEGAGGGEDAEAETGAGEEETAGTAEEEGPQWTYQMARITLAMLVLLLLAVGALYYRMIARRQRGA